MVFKKSQALITKEEGVNLKFCLADFVYLTQTLSRRHSNSCIFNAQMSTVAAQLLDQINKIHQRQL